MTPYELLLGVLAAGTNVDGRMGTNGVPLRAVIPPVASCVSGNVGCAKFRAKFPRENVYHREGC